MTHFPLKVEKNESVKEGKDTVLSFPPLLPLSPSDVQVCT